MSYETYESVAKGCKLSQLTSERFLKYMKMRWASTEFNKCVTGYAKEWAERFASGSEYHCSDLDGLRALKTIDG